MTNSETIKILEKQYKTVSMCVDAEQCQKHNKAISMAIEALKEKRTRYKNGNF